MKLSSHGHDGPPGPNWTKLLPAKIAEMMHDLAAGNVLRQTGVTQTWGCKVIVTDERSCPGASAFWKSAGANETLTFTAWDDVGVQLAQTTVDTDTSGIVSVTWGASLTLAPFRVYTFGLYVPNVITTWQANKMGFQSGEYFDNGISYSHLWFTNAANTLPTVPNTNNPPTKCTVCPVWD